MKFDYSRYETWVTVSMRWMREEKDRVIPSRIQGLGLIDAKLYGINKYDIKDKQDKLVVDEFNIPNHDYVNINSYLWVIGVYELFRMIDQRLRENENLAQADSIKAINYAKKQFQRIRIPLAKLEPSKLFKNTDYDVPKLGADEHQLSWKVNDNLIIHYRDLSDLAISTLRKLWPRWDDI